MRISGSPFAAPYQPGAKETDSAKKGGAQQAGGVFHKQSESDSILSALMEQKQKLIDSKKELTQTALSSGQSLESIQDKLKEMDKQIQQLNQQIAQQRQEEIEKKLEKAKPQDNGGGQNSQNSSGSDIADVVELGNSLTGLKTTASVKGKLKGQATVLTSEIKRDEERGQKAVWKRSQLEALDERISGLDRKAGKQIRELSGKVSEMRDTDDPAAQQPADGSDIARKIDAYRKVNENESPDDSAELDTKV